MKNQKAFITTLNDKFYYPFCYMISSLLQTTSMIGTDFIIIDIGLSPSLRNRIATALPWIQFHDFSKSSYNMVMNGKEIGLDRISRVTKTKIKENYFKLEILNIPGYTQLCHVDSDCLIVNDLKPIFNYTDESLYACRFKSHSDYDKYSSVGVLLLNTNRLDTNYEYNRLKRNIPYCGGIFGGMGIGESDQALFNELLGDQIGELPMKFNFRSFKKHRIGDDTVVLHFTHQVKPWDKREYGLLQKVEDLDHFTRKVEVWKNYSQQVALVDGLL